MTNFRPFRAVFNKNPQLYDLGLNQTKLEDTLEVLKKIKELEKASYSTFLDAVKMQNVLSFCS
jgi:hypothetical protein